MTWLIRFVSLFSIFNPNHQIRAGYHKLECASTSCTCFNLDMHLTMTRVRQRWN
jgi:hypothetical protein